MTSLTRFLAAIFCSLMCLLGAADGAELGLAALFSDHMVLQREKPVPVWGWCEAGRTVTVSFGGQEKSATADATGKWVVTLDPLTASVQPRTLSVTTAGQADPLTVSDVLVGEVWLGSGQSNMAMTVSRARDFAAERAAAEHPAIRMFTERSPGAAQPQSTARGSWEVCSPDTVARFSATLYFFGRELQQELQVPIGLLNSSVGGTPIESWIAAKPQAEKLSTVDEFDEAAAKQQYQAALERWKARAAKARAAGTPVPRKPVDPVARRRQRGGIGGLFHGKIAPLIPYGLRGVVWYQGEANSRPGKGSLYGRQLTLLVNDWRKRWGEPLPFAWVQLPNFQREGEGWMLVREGMLQTLELPRTGMAITIDIGDPKDIHPKNKQDVGKRLALWALGDVYGRPGVATSGPLPNGFEIQGGQVRVAFKHTFGGLKVRGETLQGFVISGQDRQWKAATASIEGDSVVVTHPEIDRPVAVRYAWAANPTCNLYNGAGLPASPFRTDNWTPEGERQ